MAFPEPVQPLFDDQQSLISPPGVRFPCYTKWRALPIYYLISLRNRQNIDEIKTKTKWSKYLLEERAKKTSKQDTLSGRNHSR